MKSKFIYISVFIVVSVLLCYNIDQNRVRNSALFFSLIDIEKQVNANEQQNISGKVNNPMSCVVNVGGGSGNGEISSGGSSNKVYGVYNPCKAGTGTCSPFNCRLRN